MKNVMTLTDSKKYEKLRERAKILLHMHSENKLIEMQVVNLLISINYEMQSITSKYCSIKLYNYTV